MLYFGIEICVLVSSILAVILTIPIYFADLYELGINPIGFVAETIEDRCIAESKNVSLSNRLRY